MEEDEGEGEEEAEEGGGRGGGGYRGGEEEGEEEEEEEDLFLFSICSVPISSKGCCDLCERQVVRRIPETSSRPSYSSAPSWSQT